MFISHTELACEVRRAFSEKVTSTQENYEGIRQDAHGRGGGGEAFQGEAHAGRLEPSAPGAKGRARRGWRRGSGKKGGWRLRGEGGCAWQSRCGVGVFSTQWEEALEACSQGWRLGAPTSV